MAAALATNLKKKKNTTQSTVTEDHVVVDLTHFDWFARPTRSVAAQC